MLTRVRLAISNASHGNLVWHGLIRRLFADSPSAGSAATIRRVPMRVGFSPIEIGLTMRTTRQLSITLPNEMADALRERVDSGAYASESEVIRDGLRTLFARDQALEAWLHSEVVNAYDALVADPTAVVSIGEVRARLASKYVKQQ